MFRSRAPATHVRFVQGDASNAATAAALVTTAVEEGGVLDIPMNAVPGALAPKPFTDLDPANFPSLVRAHLMSTLLVTHAAQPHIVARSGGVVLTVASDAAKIPTPGESVHGALMAALVMFSRTLVMSV